jgi:hypothetical protein
MNAVGCVPRVHIINAVWQKKRIFISPSRAMPSVGEWACPPPATVYLRRLNARSGLPHGIVSHMRDMDLVSDPGYHAAARYGVVAVEGGSHHTCPNGRSASLTKRGSPGSGAYGDPMRNPMWDLARDPWFHGRLNARSVISHGIRSSI